MSNGSTFVNIHCWANNVCQFDLSLIVYDDILLACDFHIFFSLFKLVFQIEVSQTCLVLFTLIFADA